MFYSLVRTLVYQKKETNFQGIAKIWRISHYNFFKMIIIFKIWRDNFLILLNFTRTLESTCFGREYSKTVVPKSTSNQKSTVHCGDKAVTSYFQFLTEIIPKVSTKSRIWTVRRLCCKDKIVVFAEKYFKFDDFVIGYNLQSTGSIERGWFTAWAWGVSA